MRLSVLSARLSRRLAFHALYFNLYDLVHSKAYVCTTLVRLLVQYDPSTILVLLRCFIPVREVLDTVG
jgi:hypothetical protein